MNFLRIKILFPTTFIFFFFQQSVGQVIFPGTPELEYYDLLLHKNGKLNDPITYHPSIISDYGINDSTLVWDIWGIKEQYFSNKKKFYLINPNYRFVYNSKLAKGENDGAAWAGKGVNMFLNFGFGGSLGILDYTFAPSVNYSQNSAFDIPNSELGKSEFSYPFERLDWVLRYGDDAYYNFNLGQSEIRFKYKNTTLGISNQNMKWGPAKYNPIVMSNNAAGFPHIDLGTKAPKRTKIGDIEFKGFWGLLRGSDYYTLENNNNVSYLTGFIFGYQPKYIKGLSIGLNRVMYRDLSLRSFSLRDVFRGLSGTNGGDDIMFNGRLVNDLYDQLVSATLRWKFAEVGFEAYMEMAKNDFTGRFRNLLLQPENSRAYTIGFVKDISLADGNLIKINYEHTNLTTNRGATLRPTPSYYTHGISVSGYAQNGQLIGAALGPGSNADVLDINYFFKSGLIGVKLQRVRFNDDYFFEQINDFERLDTQWDISLEYLKILPRFKVGVELTWGRRLNWYYERDNDVTNMQGILNVSYNLNTKL